MDLEARAPPARGVRRPVRRRGHGALRPVRPAAGKRPARRLYCLDEHELDTTQEKLADEGVREGSWTIARFKGLGEMSAEQLWETTLSPDTRRLLPVMLGEGPASETVGTMTMLMGRGEAAARRAWIEEHGNEVEAEV